MSSETPLPRSCERVHAWVAVSACWRGRAAPRRVERAERELVASTTEHAASPAAAAAAAAAAEPGSIPRGARARRAARARGTERPGGGARDARARVSSPKNRPPTQTASRGGDATESAGPGTAAPVAVRADRQSGGRRKLAARRPRRSVAPGTSQSSVATPRACAALAAARPRGRSPRPLQGTSRCRSASAAARCPSHSRTMSEVESMKKLMATRAP